MSGSRRRKPGGDRPARCGATRTRSTTARHDCRLRGELLGFKLGDVVKAGGAMADASEYLNIIDNEVGRSVNRSSRVCSTSAAKRALKQRVNLNDVIGRTLLLLKHLMLDRLKRMTIHQELDPGIARVPQANGEQLVQVLHGAS